MVNIIHKTERKIVGKIEEVEIPYYVCNICGKEYINVDKALKCENTEQSSPKFKVGNIVNIMRED